MLTKLKHNVAVTPLKPSDRWPILTLPMQVLYWKNCKILVTSRNPVGTAHWVATVEIVFDCGENVSQRQEVVITRSFPSREEADSYAIEMAKRRIDRGMENPR